MRKLTRDSFSGATKRKTNFASTKPARSNTSATPEVRASAMPNNRRQLSGRGLSYQASALVMCSWRDSTKKQYTPYLEKWKQYCGKRKVDPFSAPVETAINFLAELYQAGQGHNALNTARCALSTCLSPEAGKSFGSQPLVCLFTIGVFESRPALPTFSDTWDVKQVFNYLKGLHRQTDSEGSQIQGCDVDGIIMELKQPRRRPQDDDRK